MSMTPTLPSTTTSSHSFAAHHHSHTGDEHDDLPATPAPAVSEQPPNQPIADSAAPAWTDPSSLSVNALDLWLEQATAAAPSSRDNLNLNLDLLHNPSTPSASNHIITSTALSTPAITPSSHGRTPTYNMNSLSSFSPSVDEGPTLADMIATQDPAALALEFSKPSGNMVRTGNQATAVPSTPSGSTNPVSATPTPPATTTRPQPVQNNKALNDMKGQLNLPNHLDASDDLKLTQSEIANHSTKSNTTKTKPAKTKAKSKSASNKSFEADPTQHSSSVASNSDSGMLSQSESAGAGPSSALSGAYMGGSNGNSDGDDTMEALNALATRAASPTDGISAVERAKRSAEQFTISQLAKRRRKGGLPGSIGSPSSEDNGANGGAAEDDGPEAQSHRKYQKRLQKNRDSAFVSRIRRREYTRILENSLSSVEKEKDAALAAFREMKRRFDVVSAELAGIKTAAASNFGFRNPHINSVIIPDMPPGVFVPPGSVGFHPGRQPVYARKPVQPVHNPPPPIPVSLSNRPTPIPVQGGNGHFMTTMYMVALVVGVLLPEFASRKTISTAVNQAMGRGQVSNGGKAAERAIPHRNVLNSAASLQGTSGQLTGQLGNGETSEQSGLPDQSQGAADRLVDGVRANAIARLGEERAEQTLQSLRSHLRSLRAEEVNAIEQYSAEDREHEGFEALVRAALREDGDEARDADDLDVIIKQVSTLNFEDRL